MYSVANVQIHASQFPAQVQQDLIASLLGRRVNHKFHYDSVKQTQKWLALHQAYSPSRTDPDCAVVYDLGFAATIRALPVGQTHLVGLGCGGGQKDSRLLRHLIEAGHEVSYTPSDVSLAMVLVARESALRVINDSACHPLVCDLASATDLAAVLGSQGAPKGSRLFTFFGMIPNFESGTILPRLASLLDPSDWLIFSANLAPGPDYFAGIRKILPLYDNALTRDWLMTFLLDLGVELGDGKLSFRIEAEPEDGGLMRVGAWFGFLHRRCNRVDDRVFEFEVGDEIRLFFSYRHTPLIVEERLARVGIRVCDQWITKSGEEGVFLCRLNGIGPGDLATAQAS